MSFQNLFQRLSHLPMMSRVEEVAKSVLDGHVTVVTAATASGKTLLTSTMLAEHAGEQVVVIQPRRFLAQNAAETIAELSETEFGVSVGYASGDFSRRHKDTKLLFVTSGYAIGTGLVNTATLVVLDEVHETTLDLSIVRAILYRRMQQGEKIKVLEMSATMNPQRQAQYWKGVAKVNVFNNIDGATHPCEWRHRQECTVEEATIDLLKEGRRGILVFRPGEGEVDDTAEEIAKLAEAAGIKVEVSKIYGRMEYGERADAVLPPQDDVPKVLVGTNVIESGISLEWADSGVSCGTGKENTIRPVTEASYLMLVDLAQWRLVQQQGRVNRFGPGVFVLCSETPLDGRPFETRPEIQRLSLGELVMRCAGFNLRTCDLHFDYAPDLFKVSQAEEKLQRLGLLDLNCSLTEAGRMIVDLPVGPETGAMLWHAYLTDCLPEMIALAAVIEVGGVRKNYRHGHGFGRDSDYLDSLAALREVVHIEDKKEQDEQRERYNVGYKRFAGACHVGRGLQRKLNCKASFDFEPVIKELRRCVFAGSLNKLYSGTYEGDKVMPLMSRGSYSIGRGACVPYVDEGFLVAGDLRTITPRDDRYGPFEVLEKITVGTTDDLVAVAKLRPEILTQERLNAGTRNEQILYRLFGQYALPLVDVESDFDWNEDEGRFSLA